MNITVYLNTEDFLTEIDANLSSIFISIKDTKNDIYVVPQWDAPTKTGTGQYQYTFDTNTDIVYLVTWRIVAVAGGDIYLRTEHVGPFFDIVDYSIRSVAEYKGSFIPGTLATLLLKITDFDGTPVDPQSIDLTIRTTSGSLVKTDTPEKATTGFYAYDWNISDAQTPGEYTVLWKYTYNEIPQTQLDKIIIVEDATDTMIYSGAAYYYRIILESYLTCAQSIPVYFEQSKPSIDNYKYRFTFPRWNQTTGMKLYRNKQPLIPDGTGVEVDYFRGEIIFDNPLTDYDVIHADYNFRWFSDIDLNQYLENAVQVR